MSRRIPALMRRGGRDPWPPMVGGGAPAWTPESLSPAGWYRADLGITVATGVSVWADQSGNGNDLEQATPGDQPTLVGTGFNGGSAPYIDFDGTDEYLIKASFDLGSTTAISLIVIGQIRNRTNGARPLVYNSAAGFPRMNELSSGITWAGPGGAPSSFSATAAGSNRVRSLTWESSVGTEIFEDGVSVDSDVGGAASIAATADLAIGAYFTGGNTGQLRVAEFIVLPTRITPTQLTALQEYAGRYGL